MEEQIMKLETLSYDIVEEIFKYFGIPRIDIDEEYQHNATALEDKYERKLMRGVINEEKRTHEDYE